MKNAKFLICYGEQSISDLPITNFINQELLYLLQQVAIKPLVSVSVFNSL